jgi:hypothetical protein
MKLESCQQNRDKLCGVFQHKNFKGKAWGRYLFDRSIWEKEKPQDSAPTKPFEMYMGLPLLLLLDFVANIFVKTYSK